MASLAYAFLAAACSRPATTSCATGSCAPIVTALAGIAAKPKPHSIGCATPSRAYGRSIRPTSPGFGNDNCQACDSWPLKATQAASQSLPPLSRDHGTVGEERPGKAVSFYQAKDVKTVSLYMSPRRAANQGGESLLFLRLSPWESNTTSSVVRLRCFSTTLFPLSSSLPIKIRDDS